MILPFIISTIICILISIPLSNYVVEEITLTEEEILFCSQPNVICEPSILPMIAMISLLFIFLGLSILIEYFMGFR